MKARIKHTQQIIDVEWDIRGWIWDGQNGKRIFDEEELVFFDSDIDWQSFRAESAKDILCALVKENGDAHVERAIELADHLIVKLKEKEEK